MNILQLHNETQNKGGTEVYLAQLQELLPSIGHNTYWMAVQEVSGSFRCVVDGQVLATGSLSSLLSIVRAWIAKFGINVVCLHNLFDNAIIEDILKYCSVIKFSHSPVIVCPGRDKFWRFSGKPCTQPYGLHCFYHAYAEGCTNRHPKRLLKDYNFVSQEIERSKYKYRKIVVMSQYNADRLTECGIPSDNIIVNPYFTKPCKEIPVPPNTGTKLLFIGRLIEGKGVEEMINATAMLLKENSSITLHIVGDGPLRKQIEAQIASAGVMESVVMHGWLPREVIDEHLQTCYLLIFPSTYPESFGIVGIEAMMAGKPVVGFNVGGVSTWLKHGKTGLMCERKDVSVMEKNIRLLISDSALYNSLSRQAQNFSTNNFLPAKHLKVLDSLFNAAVNQKTFSQAVLPT